MTDALRLHDAGWHPIRLPVGKKYPPETGRTGYDGRNRTRSEVETDEFGSQLGARVPETVIGVDVDVYNDGDQALDDLTKRFGPLPDTIMSTARSDGSGIRFFRIPVGTLLVTQWDPGIEFVQFFHRYAAVAPSTNPKVDDAPYRWIDQQSGELLDGPPDIEDLPDLPWDWIEGLRKSASGKLADSVATLDELHEFIDMNTEAAHPQKLGAVRHTLGQATPGSTKGGRHDTLMTCACWALREARAGLYPARDAIDTLERWWSRFEDKSEAEFVGVLVWAVAEAIATGEERIADIRRKADALGEETDPGEPDAMRLDDEWWAQTDELAHIAAVAEYRGLAPEGLLAATLANVCLHVPPALHLPGRRRRGAPNLLIVLPAPPGEGKGSTFDAIDDMLPPPTDTLTIPIGTAEGFVRSFYRKNPDKDDAKINGSLIRSTASVRVRTDEVGAFIQQNARTSTSGEGLIAQIKQAISGESIGFGYATEEKRLIVGARTYRTALLFGVVPKHAAAMFSDAGGGLPERMLFAPGFEKDLTDPDHEPGEEPPPMDWTSPWRGNVLGRIVDLGGALEVDADVADRMRREQHAVRQAVRSGVAGAEEDTHRAYNCLRSAVGFAGLHGSASVTMQFYDLASDLHRVSDATRDWLKAQAVEAAQRSHAQQVQVRASEAVGVRKAVDSYDEACRLERTVKGARFVVARVAEGYDTPKRIKQRMRRYSAEEVERSIAHALDCEWVVETAIDVKRGTVKRQLTIGPKSP